LCSLREVIAAAWNTVTPSADARGITLDISVADDLGCPMERARMERVFANLFENAIEAMRSGGNISIRGEAEGDSIMVRVEDSGPGINAALRGRLFQPFVTAGKKNGLGLGLALSRQTLLDHGGDIWADDAPDRDSVGAVFWLRLPKNRTTITHEPVVLNGGADIREQSPSLRQHE
jgi:signal transduction histidine kinase